MLLILVSVATKRLKLFFFLFLKPSALIAPEEDLQLIIEKLFFPPTFIPHIHSLNSHTHTHTHTHTQIISLSLTLSIPLKECRLTHTLSLTHSLPLSLSLTHQLTLVPQHISRMHISIISLVLHAHFTHTLHTLFSLSLFSRSLFVPHHLSPSLSITILAIITSNLNHYYKIELNTKTRILLILIK